MEMQEGMPMLQNGGGMGREINLAQFSTLPLGSLSSHQSLPRLPWSFGFSGCVGGSYAEYFCTNVDMEVCLFGTMSPYTLYPNHSQRFSDGQDNSPPLLQIMSE